MFKCRQCGKEFEDWHALGGHMRTHRDGGKRSEMPAPPHIDDRSVLADALGKLSELTPQEAWQIVINWIMDVYRQSQLRDETLNSYRLRMRENESRIEAVQAELRKLQQMVAGRHIYSGHDDRI